MNKLSNFLKVIFFLVIVIGSISCIDNLKSIRKKYSIESTDKRTDPKYIMTYKNPKFVPPKDKIMLVIGQDLKSCENYISNNKRVPSGFMIYTSVQYATGLDHETDYGAGKVHAQYFADKYKNTVIQIGLWMKGALDDVPNGKYDDKIDGIAAWIGSVKCPVYFRIGYEFDGPHNDYQPEPFIKTYRYIVDRIRSKKVDNVAYVWHSYTAPPLGQYPVMKWYPGDNYVDWFGISLFNQLDNGRADRYVDSFVELARKFKKPVMVAEATPRGGIKSIKAWKKWFIPVFNYMYRKNIKMFSYINADWEEQTMWKGQGWGDTRVEKNSKIQKLWLNEINNGHFLFQSDDLWKQIGYKP